MNPRYLADEGTVVPTGTDYAIVGQDKVAPLLSVETSTVLGVHPAAPEQVSRT